jgi:hypothetical protein
MVNHMSPGEGAPNPALEVVYPEEVWHSVVEQEQGYFTVQPGATVMVEAFFLRPDKGPYYADLGIVQLTDPAETGRLAVGRPGPDDKVTSSGHLPLSSYSLREAPLRAGATTPNPGEGRIDSNQKLRKHLGAQGVVDETRWELARGFLRSYFGEQVNDVLAKYGQTIDDVYNVRLGVALAD